MPKHVDAAELVAFKIIENGDGTKSQVSIHLDVPPALKQSEQFVDPTTALHNAVFGGRPTEILKALALQPEIKSPEAALNQLGQFSPEIGKIQNINIGSDAKPIWVKGYVYVDEHDNTIIIGANKSGIVAYELSPVTADNPNPVPRLLDVLPKQSVIKQLKLSDNGEWEDPQYADSSGSYPSGINGNIISVSLNTLSIDGIEWSISGNNTVTRYLANGVTETRVRQGDGALGEGVLQRQGDTLAALGADDRVALTDGGWHVFDRIGNEFTLSKELLVSADPAHVIGRQISTNTNLELSTAQTEQLSQYLAKFGPDIQLNQLPSGEVIVASESGDVLGIVKKTAGGSVRFLNEGRDGADIALDGKKEEVIAGLSETETERQQAQQMQAGFGAVQSALSLIQALERGNTFSAALAGVSMVNQMMTLGGPNLPPDLASLAGPLRNIGAGLGAVSAAMNLADALKQGDALGILQSSANLGAQGIQLYAAMEGLALIDKAGNAIGTLGAAAQGLGAVAAGVGMVMAVESGNPVSMVSSSLSLMSAMGVIGPYGAVAAVIISLVSSMFGSDQPMLEGQAQAVWDTAGNTHVVTTQDNEGGGATATGWMNNLVSGLQSQLAGMVDANGQPLYGLVTPRLPSVGYQYDPDGFNLANGAKGHLYLKWVDENGQEQTRYYDGAGSRGDGTGETLVGDFMKRAMKAVVPAWEAETVRQHFLQDGVSATARPGERAGMPVEDAQHLTQRFMALSFPAVATPAAAANGPVYADIDGDGYLEKTDWISANQGMLAIDLNGDGKIGAGELLNLDPGSTLERNSLRWLDANRDGVLDARDPAFAALKVWIDANHDGLSQTATATSAGELQSMAAAGIVAINLASNPPALVKADGSTVALNVQQLTGDVKGVVYMMTVGGLLESQEGGETVLHAINTRQFDGQKEHTHGGDLARESGHAHIDAGNGALISTTAQTISSTSDRSDTTIGTSDRRLVSGSVGATLAGQVGAAQAAARTSASQVRETPVTFLPGGATTADQQLRQVRQDMIRNADSSLFGLGGGSGAPLVAVALAAAATQWPALAVAAPPEVLLPSGTGISASAARDNTMAVLATATSGALGIEHPRRPVMGVLLPAHIVDAGASKTDVAVQAPEAVVLRLHDAQVTAREIVGATSSIRVSREIYSEALPEVAANTPTTPGVVLDYPTVFGERIEGSEDIGLRLAETLLLANDAAINASAFPDQQPLRITAVFGSVHGQVSLSNTADGKTEIIFIPDLNYHGPASFDYTVTDQYGLSSHGSTSLLIAPVNDAPVVQNEFSVDGEDETLVLRTSDLLANDFDVDSVVDGDRLSVTRVGQAQHGQVVLGDDGLIRYLPDQDYHGPAQFTYWVGDRDPEQLSVHGGVGLETPGTVSLTINPINDAPVVGNETASSDEDRTLVFRVADLLANDADVDTASDGDVLRITRVGLAQHGQVSLVGETIRFVPDQDYNGPAQFDYWVADRDPVQLAHNGGEGIETVGTVHLNITPVNDAPVVQGEQAAGDEDHTLLFRVADLLANDTDVDSLINGAVLRITRVGQAQRGQVVLGEDGTIRFIPDRDYNGPAQFTYWVADRDPANLLNNGGDGFEIAGTMVLTILPVNDLPVVTGEHIDSDEDVVLEIDQSRLLGNDTDVDVASNAQVLRISAVSNAQHGVVELREDGKIRFFPERDFVGAASFSYTADDGNGGRVLGTTVITLAPVNDAPEVRGETIIFDEDVAQNIASALLLANESDVDNQHSDLRIVSVDNATHGAVALDPDGGIRFRPEPDYFGMAVFTYTVSDGVGGFTVGTASLQINPVNDAPRLIGERATIDEDQSAHFVVGALLENDYDVDNTHGELHISSVGNASHGTARLSDGEIVFVPDLNYFGPASFTYVVDDGVSGKSQARVDLQFNAVNDAPVVNDELINGKRNLSYTLTQASLLANDTDVEDPHSLALVAVRAPMHGVVTLNANGTITFVPENNYAGVGSFEYVVRDPGGAESIGAARIDFSRVNVNPVAVDDSFAGFEDTAFVIPPAQLLVNDKDPDATSTSLLSVTAVSNPANGTVSLQADGSIRFTPAQDYYGAASFRYQVSDGEGGNTWATAYLNVQGVNDAPVIEDIWYGRPIYGYRWQPNAFGFFDSDSGWSLVRVTNEASAMSILADPNDTIADDFGERRSNDLMDSNGNVLVQSLYRSGWLRPIDFDPRDGGVLSATDGLPYFDDPFRANGRVIAYDPDGDSSTINYQLAGSPQHGHAWVNQYTDPSASLYDHTHATEHAVFDKGAWQYYIHLGDPYSGADPFVVRATDSQGASADAVVNSWHSGARSGGGGGCGIFPVVIDLDGDGLELVDPSDSHIFVDLNGNGWRERIGWVSNDDGILALDANHDGRIAGSKEISFVSYTEGAKTDLEGLAAFDSDGDGKLSSCDTQWPSFGVLRDLNKNGVHDAGEFISLDQMGITSIGLQRHGRTEINSGNVVFGTSDVSLSDGRTMLAGDVMFASEASLFFGAAKVALAAAHPAAHGGDEPAFAAEETRSPSSSALTAHAISELASSPEQMALDELAAIRQMALLFNQVVATSSGSSGEALSFVPSADHSLTLPGSEMHASAMGSANDPSGHVPVLH
eukprot:TRINITY_DN881_c1_g1_i7.p1 TRINITY_DN881_c1_g1~~TRINITY_DN881_c1_g1_i7.p1  ORF type:complete len:2770 (+),score=474.63 TRINITY_DN881_c1_g1_i7:462-8312(+)